MYVSGGLYLLVMALPERQHPAILIGIHPFSPKSTVPQEYKTSHLCTRFLQNQLFP